MNGIFRHGRNAESFGQQQKKLPETQQDLEEMINSVL
jgi:hypothetical protein